MAKPVLYPEAFILRLPKGTLARIARLKGAQTRSDYIRGLLLPAVDYLEAERLDAEVAKRRAANVV